MFLDSPNPPCPTADCGKIGSSAAYINLTLGGYELTPNEKQTMESFYGDLYCNNRQQYKCLERKNNLTLQYAILHFDEIDDDIEEKILDAACNPHVLDDSDNFDLRYPLNYPQESEIENGITIEEIYGSISIPCVGDFIGSNVDRMNVEDISHGTGLTPIFRQL